MDISSIGGINNKLISNTIESAKNEMVHDDFEKRLQDAVKNKDEKELKKVCREFEGIILDMMYKQMKATVPRSTFLPSDPGREIFESMLDEQLMSEASKRGSFGLADMLYKQLSRNLKSDEKPTEEGEQNSFK
ncbi:MAG TPA: flagellar biosynthesis protein FlgJ [Clostridiaceae bacterium]|nr:flagellar biosynthesis protein FlgJ [Clostridiaceae bacterium]